ncbi:putative membrane protein YczE [Mycobacterium sp. OTB74]|nr:putative membrane protein YczE [Mycobacterium sp. OTB74]
MPVWSNWIWIYKPLGRFNRSMLRNWTSKLAQLGVTPGRSVALLVGLSGYGLSMALMVRVGLGLDPWDVFHQGLAGRTGLTIGTVSAIVGAVVLLGWIPLRNRPGVGTVANVIVIAVTVDAGLAVLPHPGSLPVRAAMMVGAVVLNALSTVLYIGAGMGPGPRDGLMTGLVARTGWSVRLVRTGIETTVLSVGWLLGGTVGVGTVVYAMGIGPLVQLMLRCTPRRWLAASGWAQVVGDRVGGPAVTTMSECPAPPAIPPQNTTLSPTPTC